MKYYITSGFSALLISVLGNFIYFTASHEYHVFEMTKEQPLMELIMLNHVVYVGMMVYLFPHLTTNINSVKRGVWFGVCMGIIVFVPSGFITRGAWEVPITWFFLIDIIFISSLSAAMGAIIGYFHLRLHKLH